MRDIENFLLNSWGKKPLTDLQQEVNIDLYSLLTVAYKIGLHKISTPSIKRRWTSDEDKFLEDNASTLTIPEASNLLYRSRYATYQRVKYLQLEQMINRK
ncbi:hypothetical protein [Anoxybacillus sp. TBDG-1]